MKKQQLYNLFETVIGTHKPKFGGPYPIYKNPDKKEMNDLLLLLNKEGRQKEVRFIVDLIKGDVYVSSSNVIHHRIKDIANLPDYNDDDSNKVKFAQKYIPGSGMVEMWKININGSDVFDAGWKPTDKKAFRNILAKDLSFANDYINGLDFWLKQKYKELFGEIYK